MVCSWNHRPQAMAREGRGVPCVGGSKSVVFFFYDLELVCRKTNRFKVSNTVAFITFTILGNHHLCASETFSSPPPQETLCPLTVTLFSFAPAPGNPRLVFGLWICHSWAFHVSGITQYVVSCV